MYLLIFWFYFIIFLYNIMVSSETNASAYGIQSMQVPAPPPGSNGSIYQNGAAVTNQNTEKQMAARFGGSRKILKGGLVVPPVKISYTETGGTGNTNTGSNVTASAKTQADLHAQATLDSQVGPVQPVQSAGRKKRRSKKLVGGWPAWGCMSGGRRSRRLKKSHRRLRKSRRRLGKSHRRRKSK
jgi:hypothetical protein